MRIYYFLQITLEMSRRRIKMIKVTSEVPTYDDPAKPSIKVHSHWNRNENVVLDFGDERRTVDASELKAAIDNATNTRKF
jgi:hypothetical protein